MSVDNGSPSAGKYLSSPTHAMINPAESMSLDQLKEISKLIKECTDFVDATRKSLAIPFAAFERVRQWRTKRRESRAMETCDVLLPKIKQVESSLRTTIT